MNAAERERVTVQIDTGKRIVPTTAEIVGDKLLIEGDIEVGRVGDLATDKPLSVNLKDLDARWPDAVVPFQFHDDMLQDERDDLTAAMAAISTRTRIRFQEVDWDCEDPMILFVYSSDPGASSSSVGFQGWCQEVAFWPDHGVAVAIHEIGHALGLYHEQARPDRDTVVNVCTANIEDGREHNFDKKDEDEVDLLTPYDTTSRMHYGRHNFGIEDPMGFRRHTMSLVSEGVSCTTDTTDTAVYPGFSGNDLSNEDVNALLLMYAKPLSVAEPEDRTGSSLAIDFIDADGYRDLVMGAPAEDVEGVTGAGSVLAYKGTLKHPAPWRLVTPSPASAPNDGFGSTVALGDFDMDGDLDLAVGAPNAVGPGKVRAGAVYIFTTDDTGFTQRHILRPEHSAVGGGNTADDRFGAALAARDLDGDGRAELLVGSPGRGGAGRVFVFTGSSLAGTAQPIALVPVGASPAVRGGEFGRSLLVSDITNDGVTDVSVGALRSGSARAGAVYVFHAPSATLTQYLQIQQPPADVPELGDDFGASLAAPLLRSSGGLSLAIGAPSKRKGATTRTGTVYVFNHTAAAPGFALLSKIQPGDGEVQRFGHALAAAAISGTTESLVITAPSANSGDGRAVVMRLQNGVMTKTHDMSGGGIGTSGFGTSVAVGSIDVFTLPDPANLLESAVAPRIFIGAPRFADVGGVHAFTPGTTETFYRHTLTQSSGSPWSEWAP